MPETFTMKNNLCSSKSGKIKNIHCCDYQSKTKAIVMPKKGMAEKAFKKSMPRMEEWT